MGKRVANRMIISLLMMGLALTVKAQMTPQQAIVKMTCGINVGRSLELTTEGSAGNRFIQEFYFTDFKAAGFNFVRIPIQWSAHVSTTAPYKIDSAWLARVEQVVDWSLKHGLITFINSHHDAWILENATYTTTDFDRFVAIWKQVSEKFKNKSDSLFFEIANEPNKLTMTQINAINSSVISTIRATNPKRIIIYSGNSYTGLSSMKGATIPKDSFIMATFHSYDPWNFAGLGTGTWGTTSEINAVKSMMTEASTWSKTYNIPVILGEYGTISKCDAASRSKWFYTFLEEARRNKIAPTVWSDFGDFSVYFNSTVASSKWNNTIKDIIVYTYPQSAESLAISVVNESNAQLTWKNRAADYKWIRIERKEGSGAYSSIETIDGAATTYLDKTSVLLKTYTYRVVCELSTGEITYSYTVDKKIETPISVKGVDLNDLFVYISNNELIIKSNLNRGILNFNVISTMGQVIKTGNFKTNEYHINTSDISKGMYFVNVFNSNDLITTKSVFKN
jgi:aryl-phospho-beta-D-glucosidase BglC (GH1 family)